MEKERIENSETLKTKFFDEHVSPSKKDGPIKNSLLKKTRSLDPDTFKVMNSNIESHPIPKVTNSPVKKSNM